MKTITIADALDKSNHSFQSKEAKDVRAMIEVVAEENETKIERMQVDHGMITLDVDNDKTAAKFISDLNAEGLTAVQKDYREALRERIQRRKAEKSAEVK
jgi:hypothetical protein